LLFTTPREAATTSSIFTRRRKGIYKKIFNGKCQSPCHFRTTKLTYDDHRHWPRLPSLLFSPIHSHLSSARPLHLSTSALRLRRGRAGDRDDRIRHIGLTRHRLLGRILLGRHLLGLGVLEKAECPGALPGVQFTGASNLCIDTTPLGT